LWLLGRVSHSSSHRDESHPSASRAAGLENQVLAENPQDSFSSIPHLLEIRRGKDEMQEQLSQFILSFLLLLYQLRETTQNC
jgi:hypothetical protein